MKLWLVETGSYYDTPEGADIFLFKRTALRAVALITDSTWSRTEDGSMVTFEKGIEYVTLFPLPVRLSVKAMIRERDRAAAMIADQLEKSRREKVAA